MRALAVLRGVVHLRFLIAVLVALLPLPAFADYLDVSGDGVSVINLEPLNETFAVDLGTICAGTTATKTIQLSIGARDHADPSMAWVVYADGSTVGFAVTASTSPALSATVAPPGSILMPLNWSSAPNGTFSSSIDATISLVAGATGPFAGTLSFASSGPPMDTRFGPTLTKISALNVTGNVTNCNTSADVKVVKTAAKSSINAGETAAFSITVTSLGPDTASGVVLTDVLPSGLSWTIGGADAVAAGCAGTLAGGSTLTCSFGNLTAGASRTVQLAATTAASNCGQINNTARVSASNDSNAANNASSASMAVTCPPPPGGHNIVPTGTTCQQFRDGTAADLNQVQYSVRTDGNIGQVDPGVFFFLAEITPSSNSYSFAINQDKHGSALPYFGVQNLQVYTSSDCQKLNSSVVFNVSGGTVNITVTGKTGVPLILRLGTDPNAVVGAAGPNPSTQTYSYSLTGGAASDSVDLVRKN